MLLRRALIALMLLGAGGVARSELGDAVVAEIERNPALSTLASHNAPAARALAVEALARLSTPPNDGRSLHRVDEETARVLRANPLLATLYRHDPSAALGLLTRIKQAAAGRQ